jgi:hypothetical protein
MKTSSPLAYFVGLGGTLALFVIAIAPFVFLVWLAITINTPSLHLLAERWPSLPLW